MITEQQVAEIENRMSEARKALHCLYIEVGQHVAAEIEAKVELAFSALMGALITEAGNK